MYVCEVTYMYTCIYVHVHNYTCTYACTYTYIKDGFEVLICHFWPTYEDKWTQMRIHVRTVHVHERDLNYKFDIHVSTSENYVIAFMPVFCCYIQESRCGHAPLSRRPHPSVPAISAATLKVHWKLVVLHVQCNNIHVWHVYTYVHVCTCIYMYIHV